MLQSMGSQRVGHDCVTELNLISFIYKIKSNFKFTGILYELNKNVCESWTIKQSVEELMLLNCGVGEDP